MYCLLCHEKIPRLRAWRTKSEFCSDEHAAQYKKQTLDRLLTDQNPARKEKLNPIALSEEPEDGLADDEMSFIAEESVEAREEELIEARAPIEASGGDESGEFEFPSELTDADEAGDSVEELWRLAEEIEQSDDAPSAVGDAQSSIEEAPQASRQSAEDALRALRMLASKATANKDKLEADARDTPSSPADADLELDEIEDLPPISDDMMAELESNFPNSHDTADDDGPIKTETEDAQPPAAADDNAPSILERLMEDPAGEWSATPARDQPSSQASAKNSPEPEALDDIDDSLADFAELPEPEFSFDDELVEALEASAEEDETTSQDDLVEEPAVLADDHDDPEIDPLAELIKAEEAAKAQAGADGEEDDDLEMDDAVAEQLVNELAEEAFRDDLDLQELERSLKVVPFPTPERTPAANGYHDHADDIAADSDQAIEDHPLPSGEEESKPAARAKRPLKRTPPIRPGSKRTKFKPSMVMVGVEPSLQGYLQGDPLEAWRSSAVKSAWGEEGAPAAHGFQPASGGDMAWISSQLEAFRPERSYRARTGVPMTLCTPAQAPPVEPPVQGLEPQRLQNEQTQLQLVAVDAESAIRLGPVYRPFEDAALVTVTAHEEDEAEAAIPAGVRDLTSGLQAALAPTGLFYDCVAADERFADEEDWDNEPQSSDDAVEGFDLSEDFGSEQPAAQSSGGRGGR